MTSIAVLALDQTNPQEFDEAASPEWLMTTRSGPPKLTPTRSSSVVASPGPAAASPASERPVRGSGAGSGWAAGVDVKLVIGGLTENAAATSMGTSGTGAGVAAAAAIAGARARAASMGASAGPVAVDADTAGPGTESASVDAEAVCHEDTAGERTGVSKADSKGMLPLAVSLC